MKRIFQLPARLSVLVVVATLAGCGGSGSQETANPATESAGQGAQAPRFEVDAFWPKPLPNHWILGNVVGVDVDADDHVWIVHRPGTLERMETYATQTPPAAECCVPAPPVLEFDQEGNLLNAWGGPGEGYDWPVSMHGVAIDPSGNVWIGGNGRAPRPPAGAPGAPAAPAPYSGPGGPAYHDTMLIQFTQEGKFLSQIGKAGQSQGSNDTANVKGPAKIWFDRAANEMYVADGYGNSRVVVFDTGTGAYKRHWGAYGGRPDDVALGPFVPGESPARQFRTPVHCAVTSNDNVVYVCDRVNNRIQVFQTDGTFVKEQLFYPNTKGDGSVWDIAFSGDANQTYMYIADGSNHKVHILDRASLTELTNFGDGGRQPGQFYAVHSIATDSKGNIYTTETYRGQRVQRFLYKGLASITAMEQGVVWPAGRP